MDMNYRGGMWEGGGWAGWSGVGGKWDNCNSIINKCIKKKSLPEILFGSRQSRNEQKMQIKDCTINTLYELIMIY